MPNYVTNILTITGDEAVLESCLNTIKGDKEGQHISFNKIIPMPKELEGTVSPMRYITDEEYAEQEARIARGELTDIEKSWGFSRSLSHKLAHTYTKKFGADNWYDWRVQNWGVKWDCSCAGVIEKIDGGVVITFDTAWSTPERVLAVLSTQFPTLEFTVKFADEDFGQNTGIYTLVDGEETECFQPDGGSIDAIENAMEVLGQEDYYLGEFPCEVDEEDLDDDFPTNILELAHKHQYLEDNYTKPVLERLLVLAERDEQYERAAEIKRRIEVLTK